jgi:hypothetical protein
MPKSPAIQVFRIDALICWIGSVVGEDMKLSLEVAKEFARACLMHERVVKHV